MTTTLRTYEEATIVRNLENDYPFEVHTADGLDDNFETYPEAVERAEELMAEARMERLDALRSDITVALDECENEDLLNHIKALLS